MRADVGALTTTLIDGFVSLAPAEQRLTVATYRLLAGGRPVPPAAIGEAAGWTVADVERRLDDWPGGVYLDDEGARMRGDHGR